MVVEQNVLVGGHGGVHIHEPICSAVVDNVLASNARAVATTIWPLCAADVGDCSYDPPTLRVLIDGNTLVAGQLPTSDEARQIFVNP